MLKKYNEFLSDKKSELKTLNKEHKRILKVITDLQQNISDQKEAQEIFGAVGILAQKQVKEIVEELVTEAIQAVFGPNYKFIIQNKINRNKPETFFYIEKNGIQHSIMDEHGGSLAVLSAFALRVVLCAITNKDIRSTIILDEPLKDADKSKLEFLSSMINHLSKLLKIQFIIVTHEIQLINAADKAFHVSQEKDISFVKVVE
jgi:ABC-type molybdenum transport system ATPase subunit/photorepair protein PhrA